MPSIVFPQSYFLGVTKRKEQDVTYGRLRARSADGSPSVFVLFAETAVALDRELSLLIPRGTDLRDARLALELEGTTRSRPRTNAKGVTTVEHYLEVTKFTVLTGPAAELQMARREGFDAATKAAGLAAVGDHAGAYAALASFAHPFSRFDDAVPGEILEDEADAEATQSVSPGTTPAPDAPAASEVEIVPVAVEAPAARPEAAEDPALSVEATEPSPETVPETGVPPAGPETPVPVGTAPVDPEAGSPASAEDGATVAPDAGVDLEAIAEVPVESFSDAGHVAAGAAPKVTGEPTVPAAPSEMPAAEGEVLVPVVTEETEEQPALTVDAEGIAPAATVEEIPVPEAIPEVPVAGETPLAPVEAAPAAAEAAQVPVPEKAVPEPTAAPMPKPGFAPPGRFGRGARPVFVGAAPQAAPAAATLPDSSAEAVSAPSVAPSAPVLPPTDPETEAARAFGMDPVRMADPGPDPLDAPIIQAPRPAAEPTFMSRPRFGGPRRMPPLPEPVAAGGMRP